MKQFLKLAVLILAAGLSQTSFAQEGYICEKVTKSGQHRILKKVKTKKKCEKLGGEWIKADHDHDDHSHDGNDHSHD